MLLRRLNRRHRLRLTGIVLTILGVGNLPMPWPDLHAIRHQDGPGQVCVLHDHLQRWHAEIDDGNAALVLHFHWALWTPAGPVHDDPEPGALHPIPCDGSALFGQGQAFSPSEPLRLSARILSPPADPLAGPLALVMVPAGSWCTKATAACRVTPSLRAFAPLLQRWNC